ncbi:MAG: glycosyltransferase family 4 protein [Solirubrobacteraceae bacterium]|nr:glycosyltransferase family 4 protein [Solirubrobacteraceae bacterium]
MLRIVCGTLFFPRGGSAYVTRALTGGLAALGHDVTLVAGSRHDEPGGLGDARRFYAGLPLREVDFTPALSAPDPLAYEGPAGTGPLQPSFEDRPGASDRVFAALGDDLYRRQVDAWAAALEAAGAAEADVLHLHHLTPLNAAAERVAPGVPVVAQIHGTELLMLEAIGRGAPWPHADAWAGRLRGWAQRARRLVVAPGNADRAAALLEVEPERIVGLPNGFDPTVFGPGTADRRAVWTRALVDAPRGWRPGQPAGSVRYDAATVDAMLRGRVLLYVGRFTEVKRLPLLIEAFAEARARTRTPATLVIVGGHPGEWEGEHPAETVDRIGADGVLLAGWYDQRELPELLQAADLLVLASARESFGQVLVEAMACAVPPVAAAALGPARIVDDGDTGWLFAPDDRAALVDALVEAIDDEPERRRRAARAERAAHERFAWPAVAQRLAGVLEAAVAEAAPAPVEPAASG